MESGKRWNDEDISKTVYRKFAELGSACGAAVSER
jgi:hypothetical protein